jgi:REP element-mobilizing transposase RayT
MPKRDYAGPGWYFVTVCTAVRNQDILCSIEPSAVGGAALGDPHVTLTYAGQVVHRLICNIDHVYPNISVDTFVIMPDHIHLLLVIRAPKGNAGGTGRGSPKAATPTVGIPQVINALKGLSTKQAGVGRLWQRNYYDHIIRDNDDLRQTREYIRHNPARYILKQGGQSALGGGADEPHG